MLIWPAPQLVGRTLLGLNIAQATILTAAQVTSLHGAHFVLLYIPDKFRVYRDHCEWPEGSIGSQPPSDLPTRLGSFATAKGIPFLDLTPTLQRAAADGELVYFLDDTHWNSRANELAASHLATYIEAQDWLPPRLPEGTFIKGSGAAIYVIQDRQKRVFPNFRTFRDYGGARDLSNVRLLPDSQIEMIPVGRPVPTR